MPRTNSPGQQLGRKAQRRQQRAAAAAQAARARARRRRWQAGAAIAAAVLIIGTVVVVLATRHGSPAAGPQATPTAIAAPVWPAPAPAQVPAAVHAAGLPLLSTEATDVHFHAHLDIIVDGQPVVVPADIGIAGQSAISSMHTHDATGIIHIESPTNTTFTLGQFFAEWQVPLSTTCIGTLCASGATGWRFYIDGKPYTGDPTTIVLAAHQEITAVYGNLPANMSPPDHYDFPAGL